MLDVVSLVIINWIILFLLCGLQLCSPRLFWQHSSTWFGNELV